MTKIVDYNDLASLIMKHLKKGVFTNFFLSKAEIKSAIDAGIFCFVEDEDYLILIRDYDDRMVMNFYLNDYSSSSDFWNILASFSKPIVIELAYKNTNVMMLKDFEQSLLDNGFKIITERVKLSRDKINNKELDVQSICNVSFATIEYYNQIEDLFSNSFDKYYGCIPTTRTIKDELLDNKYLAAFIGGEVVGFLRFHENDQGITIKHLAVKSEFRKQNMGKKLVAELVKNNPQKRISTWTSKDNISAIKVYESSGFAIDNYSSKVYMK